MTHQNDTESPQPVAEAESLVGVASTDLLASLVLVSNAAAEMADRLKMLMEMHGRISQVSDAISPHMVAEWGRQAHWWMEKMGDYFNATDAVDEEDVRDQSWNIAFDSARKFFPLANDLVLCLRISDKPNRYERSTQTRNRNPRILPTAQKSLHPRRPRIRRAPAPAGA
jgi:hypothetical protein